MIAAMTTADWALAVSLVTAAFTLGALVWQVTLYRLSGSRLQVQLFAGAYDSVGTAWAGPRWEAPEDIELVAPSVELARVRVTNIGRTPVSVNGIGLAFAADRLVHRRFRYSASGIPVKVHDSPEANSARLEAASSIEVVFDFWPLVDRARPRFGAALAVRAIAEPAGHRTKRSAWRKRWRIPPDAHSMRGRPTTPDGRVYERLIRTMVNSRADLGYAAMAWQSIGPVLRGGASHDRLTEVLEGLFGPGQSAFASQLLEAYGSEP